MFYKRKHFGLFVLLSLCSAGAAFSQRYLSDYDSTLFIRDTVRPVVKRFENLHIGGYMQPQFQLAGSDGSPSFEGGSFAEHSKTRFMLRRARIKVDYVLPTAGKDFPKGLFTFQIDATERGVAVRDMFLRLYQPKRLKLSLTMGLFARPFGYEINLSSAYRETPERGRMSQILMPTERDLGAMLSYEFVNRNHHPLFKLDVGAFNGQGVPGTTDFDSYKDFISRLTLKEQAVTKRFRVSGGLSFFNGGWRQETRYRYQTVADKVAVDSSLTNIGSEAPRHYYGADVQLIFKNRRGRTELRGEYWRGTQPGSAASTVSPGTLPLTPTYIRKFDGAFFYFLQNVFNEKWEVAAKWDWYDPNRKVAGPGIESSNGFTAADVRYDTWHFGAMHYFTPELKLLLFYSWVRNEKAGLTGFNSDIDDDVLTFRMQLRF